MDFEFVNPWYLLLLVLVPFALVVVRSSQADLSTLRRRLLMATRVTVILLVTVALLGVVVRSHVAGRALSVVFCLDGSRSVSDAARQNGQAFVAEALKSRTPGSVIETMTFAADQAVGQDGDQNTASFPAVSGTAEATDIASALKLALAAQSPERRRRIVLLSDGNQTTGSAEAVAAEAARLGVPIDVVPLADPKSKDVGLVELTHPGTVRAGQPVEVVADLTAPVAVKAEVSFYLDSATQPASTVSIDLRPGHNFVSLSHAFPDEGLHTVRASVNAPGDAEPANNSGTTVLQVAGMPRVLLLAVNGADDKYLLEALKQQGIDVFFQKPEVVTLPLLLGFDSVVMGNVPADALGPDRMEALRRYVYEFGGGLVMVGGAQSYGVGGYYHTPVEAALPVRVDPLREAPIYAVVLIMDKSWSMGDTLRGDVSKIDLIKEAAVAAVESLNEKDYLGVISFDSDYHVIMPMDALGDKPARIQTLSTLGSFGLTNWYPAMVEGHRMLKDTVAEYKHILLLSDGRPSGGAKDWEGLLKKITDDRIVVSTIAIGQDADKKLMNDLAVWGKGSFYFSDDVKEIPVAVLKEMRRLKELLIVEGALKPKPGRFWQHAILNGINPADTPEVLGYNRTRPKETAQVLLTVSSKDEPLLATWRYGKGQSVALATDAGDRWCPNWLGPWKTSYTRLCQQTVLSTVQSFRTENDYRVIVERGNGSTTLRVDCADRTGRLLTNEPLRATVLTTDAAGAPAVVAKDLELQPAEPGSYRAAVPVERTRPVLVSLEHRIADVWTPVAIAAGPVVASAELTSIGLNQTLLMDLAQLTGGEYQPKPEDVFRAGAIAQPLFRQIDFALLAAAALLFAFDIFLRRLPVLARLLGRSTQAD